ncbi:MAG: hypothetical protein PF501_06900 [Salinisphaera sp.]|jgi:hypothetical protein|nr:hypothetical protein [Salinisphaera sp.]
MASQSSTVDAGNTTPTWQVVGLWALVTIPALWGFIETLTKAVALFNG